MTPRALRLYEERGLVAVHRDRLNRCHFDGAARRRLGWTSQLRAANISLPDIRFILNQPNAQAVIGAALAKVNGRAFQLRRHLRAIDELSRQLARAQRPGDSNDRASLAPASPIAAQERARKGGSQTALRSSGKT